MANPENIAGQGFHTNPERIGKGRQKGTKNRSTVLKEMMAMLAPDGKTYELNVDKALIDKALEGDVPAIKEIKDSLYGKITDTQFNLNVDSEAKDIDTADVERVAKDIVVGLQEDY